MLCLLYAMIQLQVSMWIPHVLGMSLSGFLSSFLVHLIFLGAPVVTVSLNMVWFPLSVDNVSDNQKT